METGKAVLLTLAGAMLYATALAWLIVKELP